MSKFYENLIPKELHEKLKASEIREIENTGQTVTILFGLSLFVGFVWAIMLVAWLIWMNKFTLFLFSSSLVALVLVGLFTVYMIRVNSKDIKKLIESLKERE